MAGDLLGMQNTGALFVAVLKSRTAQETLVDRFGLQSVYGHPSLGLQARREDACKELENNTETEEDRKSGIITVSVVDKDPKRAAALAEGYIDELNHLLSTLNTSAAARERVFLEGELAKVKKELDEADRNLSQFSSKNTTLDPRDQGKAMVEAAATLEGQLIAAQSELSGLQAIYTDQNVRVRTLVARIAELKKQLANQASGGLDSSSSADTGTNSELGFPSIRKLPLIGYAYADLYRKARIEETVYGVLTQQYEAAKVQEAKETPTVRVLDPADIPEKKYGPHRALLVILGAILGFLIGSVWVIGRNQWVNRDEADPYKLFLTEVAESCQRNRVWRSGEDRVRKVIAISKNHISSNLHHRLRRNGTPKNGSNGNGTSDDGLS